MQAHGWPYTILIYPKPSEAQAPTFADPAVESFPLRYEEEITTALD